MKIKLSEYQEIFKDIAKKYVSEEEAEYFAEQAVESDIRKPSHDKHNFDMINDIKAWASLNTKLEKSVNLPSYTQFNFNG